MFNSFYGETLKAYQNWAAGTFRSPAVPDRPACAKHADRVRDYLLQPVPLICGPGQVQQRRWGSGGPAALFSTRARLWLSGFLYAFERDLYDGQTPDLADFAYELGLPAARGAMVLQVR